MIEIASSAGRRHLAAEEVGLVEVRGDSLRNGAVIGFRDALIERTTVVYRADALGRNGR